MARTALYLRVSTGEHTTANQRRELEAWAARAGHEIVAVYEDASISGTQGRDQRRYCGNDRSAVASTRFRAAIDSALVAFDMAGTAYDNAIDP